MTFSSEKDFENHIRELLESEVAMPQLGFTILRYNGIADIIVCRETPPAVFFIEVKYARDIISVNEGIQSEVLSETPPYINDHFLWLIGSEKRDGEYWLLDSSELAEYVPNIKRNRSIQNNISRRIFWQGGLTRAKLVNRLREWLYG